MAEKGVAAKIWRDASGMLGGALSVSFFADQPLLEPVLGSVLAALIQTAWRQRWRESQVYRASLNASPDDGAGHENA